MKHNPFKAKVTVAYDEFMAQENFDNNFQLSPLFEYRNRGGNTFQFIDWGNVELIDNLHELFTIKTTDKKVLAKFADWLDEEDLEEMSADEIYDEIFYNYGFDDLDEFADDGELEIDRHYILYNTHGYSQGDYARVLIPTRELRKAWGNTDVPDDELVSEQYIDNLLWDMPIWGRVEIFSERGQDYEFDLFDMNIPDYLNYPQDIDYVNEKIVEFIKKVFKHAPAIDNIIAAVEEALPEEIRYPKYC